ncbi:PDC sensor domain-containing protein [Solidesulfovibrio magneticus]|uniref:Lipoprotein n=1 Tax=Solidesulfovibrio magneticus (strain ATCC 700980 / DSM 13731 / RS-1) TaxID=573370 RepID=C4XSD1_SOLM1|nr:PDC sensor domain-containing protein [Solidesulfovibrio magneticus]BAH75653.1 hypothetical protein DMR_21620 [Solidesulfovibrio magneticus RS-1]
MKRTVLAAIAAIVCLCILAGCGTMKTQWRETRKLYREYINTDPSIDFSDQGISDKGLQRLAALMMPVDERLLAMLRTLGSQDAAPDPEWAQQLLSANAWLSGIAVVDASGAIVGQVPSTPMRPLDYASLLDMADRYKVRKMGARVVSDEMGTVVMIAMPFFKENEWAGLVVVNFDPRNLVRFSPDPNALVVVSTEGLLWAGGAGQGESLAALKWSDILKGEVQGDIRTGGGEYVWQARYLGQLELVYLTDAREVRAAKPEPKKEAAPAPEPNKALPSTEPLPQPTDLTTP